MRTVYECILGNDVFYAQTQRDALQWLADNPNGKYRHSVHNFVIKGDALL